MKQLFGYIFDWSDPREQPRAFLEAVIDSSSREIKPFDKAQTQSSTARRWASLWYLSRRPLLGEEPGGLDELPTFRYRIYVRTNSVTGSVILAAQRYTITDAALEAINHGLAPDLRRRVINVNEVLQHLFKREPQQYAVTYLMADVAGHRPFVSTIAIHGEDIGASSFLLDERQAFTARQIGVRSIHSRMECGRFGNSGSIQFNLENSDALELFLAYTYSKKFYIA